MLTRHVLWAAKPPPTEEMKIRSCVDILGTRKRNPGEKEGEKRRKERKRKKERKKKKRKKKERKRKERAARKLQRSLSLPH